MKTYIITQKEKGENSQEVTHHTIIQADELRYGLDGDETAYLLFSDNNTCRKEIAGLFRDFVSIIQVPENENVKEYITSFVRRGFINPPKNLES
jgi:hypothetical protein